MSILDSISHIYAVFCVQLFVDDIIVPSSNAQSKSPRDSERLPRKSAHFLNNSIEAPKRDWDRKKFLTQLNEVIYLELRLSNYIELKIKDLLPNFSNFGGFKYHLGFRGLTRSKNAHEYSNE